MGQTEKNSVRANVFRFALKLGHCSMHSACLKSAKKDILGGGNQLWGMIAGITGPIKGLSTLGACRSCD
jgi:hypothetical protein